MRASTCISILVCAVLASACAADVDALGADGDVSGAATDDYVPGAATDDYVPGAAADDYVPIPPSNGPFCCDEPPRGCTRTQGYWKNHEADWPIHAMNLGEHPYKQDELLAILDLPSEGDASINLGLQLIAAILNVKSGASSIHAIGDAQAWLSAYAGALPYGVPPSSAAGQQATILAEALAAYNEGRDGPGHCDHQRRDPRPSDPDSSIP